jgi:hypothetical protein
MKVAPKMAPGIGPPRIGPSELARRPSADTIILRCHQAWASAPPRHFPGWLTQARRDVCAPVDRALCRERCFKPLAQKVWVYDSVGNADIEEVMDKHWGQRMSTSPRALWLALPQRVRIELKLTQAAGCDRTWFHERL